MRSAVSSRTHSSSYELLEPSERRLGGLDPRLCLLAVGEPVVLDAEHADQ